MNEAELHKRPAAMITMHLLYAYCFIIEKKYVKKVGLFLIEMI